LRTTNVKQHKSLKGLSPATAAGICDALWSTTDLANMVGAVQPKPGKRGPYKKDTLVNLGHQTQWAAQFAVASELCKRGYEVAFTLGHNTPLADLMVISPIQKKHFLIDVKGLRKRNPWIVKRKDAYADLYYVLVFLAVEALNEFFILPQKVANDLVAKHLERPTKATKPRWDGFSFSAPQAYRGKWEILPQ
jgi:hypothetical protein